ncbi:4-hydroxy-tetrahydrodipicolinate synthase [Lysobacter silvestris]|uniref:4-hydroxy-tetrahydrodipicolinate synthase n=1 Tax=Solilutibacter silvestris TaxID=1645665 RepID=A0A2K1PYV4_9GAMM|nr:4-hydroxy-tetrahydrodipicolinate synthase [Lysobacter silvestris]PNS07972.1 dapA: dihydrodipicolinate synthase [Lysobacter silvestris]
MQLSGIITALATPFTLEGAVDFEAWSRLIAQQLEGGVHGIVVAGSTGEANALDDGEYDALLQAAVRQVAGRVPVLAGTGTSNTAKTIALTRRAAQLGADAALVVTPPYVRPTQDGLIAHFRTVADQGGLPVVLYNVPGRTGCDMQPATVAGLASHPNIIAIKEAVDGEARMQTLLALRSPQFAVLSGDDPTASRAILAGAAGLVSVGSNAAPRAFRRLFDLAHDGRAADAQAQDGRMRGLHAFLAAEPNPIPVKALLAEFGYGHGLRLPLLPLSAGPRAGLAAIVAAVRDLEAA